MKYIFALIGLAYGATAFSAPQVKTYKYGELQTYLAADFLYATQSFDDSGSTQSVARSGDYFYVLEMPIGVRYSLSDYWAVTTELQFAASESKTSDPLYRATRNNSTFNEIRFGTDFLIKENPIELIPEFELILPLEKYDNSTDFAMTSEGVMQITAALRTQQKFGHFVTFGRLGYTYRAGGRSSLVPYSVAMAIDSGKTLYGAELAGFQSISNDQDKNNALARQTTITKVEAGVRRFYSINPSGTDLNLFMNMNLSNKWKLDFNFGYTILGTSYSQAPHVGTMLTMNWDLFQPEKNSRQISAPLDPESQLSTEKNIEHFKEEVQDGVDQDIFKPQPTPKPVPVVKTKPRPKAKVTPKAVAKKPIKKIVQKRSAPARLKSVPSDDDLQEQLDNTEMKIQLRKNRK